MASRPSVYVDVILPEKLSIMDITTFNITSKKYGSFNSVITLQPEVAVNIVKQTSIDARILVGSYVHAHQIENSKISVTVDVISSVKPFALNESTKIDVNIGVQSDVNAVSVRQRMLSDLDGVTLSEINDMTLQELYWIEK